MKKGVNKACSFDETTTPPDEKGVNKACSFDETTTPPDEKGGNKACSTSDNYSTEASIALTSAIKSSFFVFTAFTSAFLRSDFALFGLLKLIISSAAAL